ncbi:MAG: O-antigen ligase family protein [Pseudomonadota bacterium]
MQPATVPQGWMVDRQFAWVVAFMVGFAYTASLLPPGFVFDPVARESLSGQSASVFKITWIPLILLSMGIILLRFRLTSALLPHLNWGLMAFLVWGLASTLWAPDAAAAFRQSFSIVGAAMLPLAFMLTAWRRDGIESVLRQTSTLLLVLSLLVALVNPAIGIHDSSQFELNGSWRGITYQKNGLGQLAAAALILWCHAWVTGSTTARAAAAGALLSVFMLLKSRSSTSLLLAMISCALIIALLRPMLAVGRYKGILVVSALLAVVVPTVVYFIFVGAVDEEAMAQAFGEVFGKDATFSGRTIIWAEMLRNIGLHPWLGIGFNSFWFTPAADETIRRLGWDCPSAHNGYLDVINHLGFIGFSLFMAFMVTHFRDIGRLLRLDRKQGALHLGLFLYVSLGNLTESGWFVPMAPGHLLAMYSVLAVSRLLYQHRLETALPLRPAAQPGMPQRTRALPQRATMS